MAPQRLDRLFLVVAKAAASIPHGQRGLGFVRIGLKWLQQCGAYIAKALLAWRANVVDGAGAGGAADADPVGEADGRAVRRLDGADDQCAHVMLQVALLLTVTVMPSPMVMGPVLAAL